jgi:hypothetical protein
MNLGPGIESKVEVGLTVRELQALIHNIKQVYYQDYKAACNQEDGDKTNASVVILFETRQISLY